MDPHEEHQHHRPSRTTSRSGRWPPATGSWARARWSPDVSPERIRTKLGRDRGVGVFDPGVEGPTMREAIAPLAERARAENCPMRRASPHA